MLLTFFRLCLEHEAFLLDIRTSLELMKMAVAALLRFLVTDCRSVSLSIALLIAVSDTPRWVTYRHSAQLGVVEIFWLIWHVDILIYYQRIWCT
jgi:hypothetical protein